MILDPKDEMILGELPFHRACEELWWKEEGHEEYFAQMAEEEKKALRYNEGKVQYSYLLELPKSLGELCRVFEMGAKKYARGNWQKGGKPDEEYLDSAMRHMMDYKSGKTLDPEGQTHHLAHAVWNLLVLVELNHFKTYDVNKDSS